MNVLVFPDVAEFNSLLFYDAYILMFLMQLPELVLYYPRKVVFLL